MTNEDSTNRKETKCANEFEELARLQSVNKRLLSALSDQTTTAIKWRMVALKFIEEQNPVLASLLPLVPDYEEEF
jgi:hypothetical protein